MSRRSDGRLTSSAGRSVLRPISRDRRSEKLELSVRLHVGDVLLSQDTYSVVSGEVHRQIALSDPGIDDYRNELLWSPSSPTIIDAELELLDSEGQVIDHVRSYTALRAIGDSGRPFHLEWTAPDTSPGA